MFFCLFGQFIIYELATCFMAARKTLTLLLKNDIHMKNPFILDDFTLWQTYIPSTRHISQTKAIKGHFILLFILVNLSFFNTSICIYICVRSMVSTFMTLLFAVSELVCNQALFYVTIEKLLWRRRPIRLCQTQKL